MGFVDLVAESSVQAAIQKIDAVKKAVDDVSKKGDTANAGIDTLKTGVDEIKAELEKIKDGLDAYKPPVYGFIEHNAILSPTSRIEYIGFNKDFTPIARNKSDGSVALNSWSDFPLLLANKPWMVHSDGTPDYRLNEGDYTQKETGGASDVSNTAYDGGAFSWLMKIYKREYMVGDDRYVLFRFDRADGFEPVGFIDPDGNELEGVWLPMFYGSVVDGKMRSLSGLQPDYGRTTEQQKAAIDAFSSRAVFLGGPIVETVIDLLLMFAKTTNLQEAYGYGNCNGYDGLAPTYGVKPNAVIGGGQFFGTDDRKSLNKIFHSIVLGSYQQWMRDPYEVVVNGRVKVSKNYVYDVTGGSYMDTGVSYPANASGVYPNEYRTIPRFGALPVPPYMGSSSTGGCDGLWVNVAIAAVALRFCYCRFSVLCGSRALDLSFAAPHAQWNAGCADLLLPLPGVAV